MPSFGAAAPRASPAPGTNETNAAPRPPAAEIRRLLAAELTSRARGAVGVSVVYPGPHSVHTGGVKILFVDDDETVLASAKTALAQSGATAVMAATAAAARQAVAEQHIDATIVDVCLGDESGLELVRELREAHAGMVIVVLSRLTEFTTKIEALRAGADAYFEKPVDWLVFSRTVLSLLDGVSGPARVLVVEDDRVSAAIVKRMLENDGHEVGLCSDAARFDQILGEFRPDLILMDIELPQISGTELTRYLRQDQRFETVPVIYLTGIEGDPRALAEAAASGEQVLRKPVPADVLLATVAGRLEHFRRLRRMMERDVLTGVMLRRPFLDRVEEAVARKSRALDRRFSLVFLDVDRFKEVNDVHGHAAGDRVLAALGDVLRRGTRTNDAVARYGGEEFAILMDDAGGDAAATLVNRLLDEFRELRFPSSSGDSFGVTFSAGVAELQEGDSGETWLGRADEALYVAKASGRDRVRTHVVTQDAADPAVLDEETIANLRLLGELAGQDVLQELVDLFLRLAPERIAAITSAVQHRDAETLRRTAHALRSASGNVGATAMHLCCARLEDAGATASWSVADTSVRQLAEAYEGARVALRRVVV